MKVKYSLFVIIIHYCQKKIRGRHSLKYAVEKSRQQADGSRQYELMLKKLKIDSNANHLQRIRCILACKMKTN